MSATKQAPNPSYVIMLHVRCDNQDTALALAMELNMAAEMAAEFAVDSSVSSAAEIELGQLTMARSDHFEGFPE